LQDFAPRQRQHNTRFVAALLMVRIFHQGHPGMDDIFVVRIEFCQAIFDHSPQMGRNICVLSVDL
jgi:hypothetical protein